MTTAKNITNILAVAVAAVALAGTTQAGTWSESAWNNDTELLALLSASATYTHAIDFEAGAAGNETTVTIAGVNFTQFENVDWQNIARNGTHLATGNAWALTQTDSYNASFSQGPSGTESAKIGNGGPLVNSGQTETFTLSGLSPNTDYVFTYFNSQFDLNDRTATLDGGDDGAGNTFTSAQANTFVSYAYNTGASTTFTMDFSNANVAFISGFINEEIVGPPATPGTLIYGK